MFVTKDQKSFFIDPFLFLVLKNLFKKILNSADTFKLSDEFNVTM